MDFDDTPEEAAFRREARAFLEANAVRRDPRNRAPVQRTVGGDAGLAAGKAWQRRKAEAGFAGITWPRQWGGRGGSVMQQVIYNQEEAGFDTARGVVEIGLGMCIPTMMAYAKPEQLERYVKPALFGDEVWCQLFSEPSAGSDLAGLRTRAVRDGDDWVINGQKIWTSGAHFSDFAIIVTRTDPSAPKHQGLTFFFLDMKANGIEVRPIRQISGGSNFNEVFFTDVRIADAQRLGRVGEGWKVSLTTLMNERLAVGDAPGPDADDIIALARDLDIGGEIAIRNPAVRERLADWYVKAQGLKLTKFRTMTALSRGETPGPEASITKLVSAGKAQEIASYGMDLMGMAGGVVEPEYAAMNAWFQQALLYAPGMRIAGGTDEVLRNIIAERVLGLPADIRVDKEVAFDRLPTGTR